jgi:hypothetical protein
MPLAKIAKRSRAHGGIVVDFLAGKPSVCYGSATAGQFLETSLCA